MKFDFSSVLPPAATELAHSWDHLYWFLFIVCVVFFAVVMVPLVVFLVKYRKKPGRKTDPIAHNTPLEIVWTAIPTVVLMVIFAWGWLVWRDMVDRVPNDAMEIHVVAESWNWTFQYSDGRIEKNRLVVPVDTPIKLKMTSKMGDVLHSFYVPNFRMKKDLVPSLYTQVFFTSKMVGRNIFFCTEYCGLGHSAMWGEVIVLSKADFELWQFGKEVPLPEWVGVGGQAERMLAGQSSGLKDSTVFASANAESVSTMQDRGKTLFRKMGCVACHSDDGSTGVGPSMKGLYGSERLLARGESQVADENYIRESIENPQAKLARGFEDKLMPPYPGHLSELELNALVAYIKGLQ